MIKVFGYECEVVSIKAAPSPGVGPGQLKLTIHHNGQFVIDVIVSKIWYEDDKPKPLNYRGYILTR